MQSWQSELINLQLSLFVKPLAKYSSSIGTTRKALNVIDKTLGRIQMPRGTRRQPVTIPGAAFDAEWVWRGKERPNRTILYLPGGGFIMRSPNTHVSMVSRLCKLTQSRGLVAYYRLAPEHLFPACLEDSILAYRSLLDEGIDPSDIIVAGDSAGGGLAVSTLLKIKEEGLPMPACAYLMSPFLDVGDQGPSRWKNSRVDALLPAPHHRTVNHREMVIGDEDVKNPLISPVYGDFDGFCPILIQVSDTEILLSDSLRMARRGHIFDIKINVDIWRKLPHVWQLMPFLPESGKALRKASEFILAHTE